MGLLDVLKSLNYSEIDADLQNGLEAAAKLIAFAQGPVGSAVLRLSPDTEELLSTISDDIQVAERLLKTLPS